MGHDKTTKLFFWLEDWDQNDIPEIERKLQLENAVREFNDENQTNFVPHHMVDAYYKWQMDRYDQ